MLGGSVINTLRKINKKDIYKIAILDILLSIMTMSYRYIFIENIFSDRISKLEVLVLLKSICSIKLILFLVAYGAILTIIYANKDWICENLYKYRFIIAISILIIGVFFEISGSSIGCWNGYIPGGESTSEGVLLGTSRPIRSDEWATNTTMTFSQYFSGFSYFSDIIRGTETDTFIVYGQPVMNLAILFRPFQIGYLFLSPAKGLSFFWLSRLIALFMVTFEFAMIITKKNKKYSVMTAFLLTFAPIVQWWFAINGLVEMLVFGQLAIILIYKYMRTNDYRKRMVYSLVIAICAGGYILTFYPAWQVPLAYVFLALAIWIFISEWKEFKFYPKKDIPIISIAVVLLAIGLGYVIVNSLDTIKAVMGTAYPGKRVGVGGETFGRMWQYICNLFFPLTTANVPANPCEMAVFFDLFPIGLILSLIVLIKEKKKDILIYCLLAADIFLSLYCVIAWPEVLAKVTLLSFTTGARAYAGVGLINILLLVRSLSITDMKMKKSIALIISLALSCVVVKLAMIDFSSYLNSTTIISLSILILLALFYMIFRNKGFKGIFATILCVVMLFMGALVNPVRHGTGIIFESELTKKIQEIAKNDSGLWITEDLGLPMINYPMMVGAPTINSTNVYPVLDRWAKLDTEGVNEEIYNRYAHITIKINNTSNTEFTLLGADAFTVNLNVNDMNKLDIKYILSRNDLEDMSNDNVKINKLYEVNDYKIYEVNYK